MIWDTLRLNTGAVDRMLLVCESFIRVLDFFTYIGFVRMSGLYVCRVCTYVEFVRMSGVFSYNNSFVNWDSKCSYLGVSKCSYLGVLERSVSRVFLHGNNLLACFNQSLRNFFPSTSSWNLH